MKTYSSSYPFTFLAAVLLCLLLAGCLVNDGKEKPDPPCAYCPFDFWLTDYAPAWSPDGATIAYVHSDTIPGESGIYFINPDGTNKRQWHSGSASAPAWSPDGQWITFHQGAQIYIKSVSGDSLVQLTTEGRNFFPSWSPDGEWIAYDSNVDSPTGLNFVWKMKADGSEKKRIAYTPDEGETRMPSWRMGGNNIVHIRFLVRVFSSEIYTMNADGSATVRLTNNEDTDRYPEYSPDGAHITYTSQPEGGRNQIWVMNSDGSNPQELTEVGGYHSAWSPDGAWIIYTDPRTENGRLWLMRPDGSEKQQLTFE